jgi:K+-sensing histidine kinase KdpD
MRFLDLDTPLQNADLVFTSEGCIDSTTTRGKIPGEVARRAKVYGHPVVALVGMEGKGAEAAIEQGIDTYTSIINAPMQKATALLRAPELLAKSAEQVMRTVLVGKRLSEHRRRQDGQAEHTAAVELSDQNAADPLHALIGAMSEELRTPLNLIIGYSKMVKDGLLGTISPEQEKALQQVIKNSYWVLMMMNGLLQSSGSPDRAAPMPIADALVSEVLPTAQSKYPTSS